MSRGSFQKKLACDDEENHESPWWDGARSGSTGDSNSAVPRKAFVKLKFIECSVFMCKERSQKQAYL